MNLFVQIHGERQLFRGTSGGNVVQGLLTSRGVPVYAGGTAVGNKAVQLFQGHERASRFGVPRARMDRDAADRLPGPRLLAETAGQFFGSGPFVGAYGDPTSVEASGQITGATDTIWGKSCYVTSAIGGAGTAIVGTREGTHAWSRGGLRVESTNSHSSGFTADITAIRAERRLACTANAYVEVRLSEAWRGGRVLRGARLRPGARGRLCGPLAALPGAGWGECGRAPPPVARARAACPAASPPWPSMATARCLGPWWPRPTPSTGAQRRARPGGRPTTDEVTG